MKLTNSTDFEDHFLRRMISWSCKQLELPVRHLRSATFRNSSKTRRGQVKFSGWAYSRDFKVGVTPVEPSEPVKTSRFGRTLHLADRAEILVMITAHELCHCRQGYQGREFGRRTLVVSTRERECDREMAALLELFRADRDALMQAWQAAPVRRVAAAPKLSAADKREAAARANLKRWETKAKAAANKVKAYRAKVRYYDRRAAVAAKKAG